MSNLPEITDDPAIIKARELYWQFVMPEFIRKETGLTESKLRRLMYGKGEHDPNAWFMQRRKYHFEDRLLEEMERTRKVFHEAVKLQVDSFLETVKHYRQLKDKKGNPTKTDFNNHDLAANVILKYERIIPLLSPVLADQFEASIDAPKTIEAKFQVVTQEKVLQAIKKDKSMLKHILALKEQEDGNTESNGPSREAHRPKRSRDRVPTKVGEDLPQTTGHSELDASVHEINRVVEDEEPTDRELERTLDVSPADRRATFERDDGASAEGHALSSDLSIERSVSGQGVGAKTDQDSEPSDEADLAKIGEVGAGEQSFAAVPETGLDDLFEDEFS